MKSGITYPIRYVAQCTRLKPYLIRTWEERYGAVRPIRSPSNRRLYTDADIRRLTLLKRAVEAGHSISTVAALSDEEIDGLLMRREHQDSLPWETNAVAGSLEDTVDRALDCIARLDAASLENVLSDAAIDLPRQSFLQYIVMPMFKRIGDLWRDGRLKIINEHLASMIVRSILWDMLRSVSVTENAPRLVIGTPVGHLHEFGALASALAASESGWQPCYFGPNLPSEELVYAVKQTGAKALALSLCHRIGGGSVSVELRNTRRLTGPHLPIFVGGFGTETETKTIRDINATVVQDLGTFRMHLERLGQPQ